MFNLAYKPTDEIEVGNITYKVDLAFDNILRVIDLMNDKEINDVLQVETANTMLVGETDWDLETKSIVLNEIFKEFLGFGKTKEIKLDILGNPMPSNNTKEKQSYCLKQDAEYIYASFMSDYKMDLIEQQGKLTWSKFNALLMGLSEETMFKQIIHIRTSELPTGKGSGKERKHMEELKERYALEDEEIEEE